ncbi:MAG TPA: LysM peptidoglycan-binding domain-containing protein [Pyrinomonadaceae bacterium]|nr:LysM peptidoglycan-binding domain-containing protein [Pyrinomonadaceae bacterium]
MGLFDKMFGRGATAAEGQADAQKRFNELKTKYQSVLNTIEREDVRLVNLHVEGDKLFIRGSAPSEDVKNKVWEQIKLVDANNANDLTADITVDAGRAAAAAAGGGAGEGGQRYTVKAGDTLSKISKQFYGDANEYMRIFYANKDKLKDPDKIQVGQELNVPSGD